MIGMRVNVSVSVIQTGSCNSSSKSSIASFFPVQAPGKHEIHKYGLGQNTYTHEIKLNLNMWTRHFNIE